MNLSTKISLLQFLVGSTSSLRIETNPWDTPTSEVADTKTCAAIRESNIHSPANAYKNIEAVTRGYNIFFGSPFSKNDKGPASYMFTFDWSNTK